jgi:hypothetical protein
MACTALDLSGTDNAGANLAWGMDVGPSHSVFVVMGSALVQRVLPNV